MILIIISKRFIKNDYQLCMDKRIKIIISWLKGRVKLINKKNEVYRAYSHNVYFYVFGEVNNLLSTNEGINLENEAR